MKSGQTMLETVLAVVIIASVFWALFGLAHMLTGKILLEHAAMRVARARSVGMNSFVCAKTARASVVPISGRCLWPSDSEMSPSCERARVAIYMGTPNAAIARGVLDYEGWSRLSLPIKKGDAWSVSMKNDWFDLSGHAVIEEHHGLYMNDLGR